MSNVNPYWNSLFYTVAKTKSFLKASEKLQIKRSTISRNIDLLENELNTTLFYRDNRGVSLTADGKIYFNYVEQALNLFDAGEKVIKSNNDIETGEMTIGSLSHISHFYLIDNIKK